MECHLSSNQSSCYDAVVIGAGASGLVCAAELGKRGLHTLLVEQNKKSGRKLYATGNGRCNIANAVLSDSAYYQNGFAASVVTEESVSELKDYLKEIGIPLTSRDPYLYPVSQQASAVVWALTDAARLSGVVFLYDTRVERIRREKRGGYVLYTGDGKEIRTGRLVLSMGSPAAPKLGAAGADTLYGLLNDLGLPYREFQAALCPLETEEDLSELAGVRVAARLTVGDESEEGELQLTDYGLSGIVTFNLSTLTGVGDTVKVDLLPDHDEAGLLDHFLHQNKERRLFAVLNGLLPEKLCGYFLRRVWDEGALKMPLSAFSGEELKKLIRAVKHFQLKISGKRGDKGQACQGGVRPDIISPSDLSVIGSKEIPAQPGLAVTGELLDVVGRCGGYNLMFALISGRKAGRLL